MYINNCTIIRHDGTQTCGKTATYFGIFLPSAGRYSTKETTKMASYVIDVTVRIQLFQWKKSLKTVVQNVQCIGYYLNIRQLQKLSFYQGYVPIPCGCAFAHGDTDDHRRQRDISLKTTMNF
jgi:hypothetical protein